MIRESLDRFCERGILGLVLAVLGFGSLSGGAVRTQEFLVLLGLTAGVLLLWGVRLWLNERPKLLCPPICWMALAFVLYAIGRYLTCDIEYVGRLELLRILVYTALFFAILNNLHRQEATQIIAFAAVFLAMSLAMCAVWQNLTNAHRVPSLGAALEAMVFPHKTWFFARIYPGRGSGAYISPNHLAGWLELLLPLALAYPLTGRAKPVTKILLGYAALVILVGIGMTGSRGSWAATAVALLVFFVVLASHRSYRLPALVMLVLLAGACAYFLPRSQLFKQRLEPSITDKRLDLNVRYELWDATVAMWRDHQWTGVGPGHYDYRFRMYRPQSVQLRPDRAHNEYLNLLADWGITGAVLIGGILVTLLLGIVKSWRYVRRTEREFASNRSNKFAFVVGATAGWIALLVHSTVDFNLQIPANAALAVTLAALLSSHLRFATEKYWLGAGTVVKALLSIMMLAGTVYFTQQTIRLGREYLWREEASTKGGFSDERIAALAKAYAVEPKNAETAYTIGEAYRTQSSEGGHDFEDQEGYERLAEKALVWYSRGTNANPYEAYNYLGLGRCLDWLALGRPERQEMHEQARTYFLRADELDPNGYWTSSFVGWHYVQVGDYAAAKPWLERSLKLQRTDNPFAAAYLEITRRKLAEEAAIPGTRR